MLKKEFEIITNLYPTETLYEAIDRAYLASELSKEDFCRDYLANKDGIAEKIQQDAEKIAMNEVKSLYDEIQKLTAAVEQWKLEVKSSQNKIEKLKEQLYRELEWRPYENPDRVTQAEYDELARDADEGKMAAFLTEDEAKERLYKILGFAKDAVEIHDTVKKLEKNRHGGIRSCGLLDRRPVWASTDYHYMAFSCRGYAYELYNGERRSV